MLVHEPFNIVMYNGSIGTIFRVCYTEHYGKRWFSLKKKTFPSKNFMRSISYLAWCTEYSGDASWRPGFTPFWSATKLARLLTMNAPQVTYQIFQTKQNLA